MNTIRNVDELIKGPVTIHDLSPLLCAVMKAFKPQRQRRRRRRVDNKKQVTPTAGFCLHLYLSIGGKGGESLALPGARPSHKSDFSARRFRGVGGYGDD